jgi:hypothetical protein
VEKFSKVLPTATYCDFGVNANWRRNPKADQTKSEGRFSTAKYANYAKGDFPRFVRAVRVFRGSIAFVPFCFGLVG